MKFHRNPIDWPKGGLLPALLLRLPRAAVEQRLGQLFFEFEDEGEDCAGLGFTCDDGTAGAIMVRGKFEITPSIYLAASVQQDWVKVDQILKTLHLSCGEILDSRSREFSPDEIMRGKHVLPL